jgi:hypothetical protein
MGNGTCGRNALTGGDPGMCQGTGSDKPPGNLGADTPEGSPSQAPALLSGSVTGLRGAVSPSIQPLMAAATIPGPGPLE